MEARITHITGMVACGRTSMQVSVRRSPNPRRAELFEIGRSIKATCSMIRFYMRNRYGAVEEAIRALKQTYRANVITLGRRLASLWLSMGKWWTFRDQWWFSRWILISRYSRGKQLDLLVLTVPTQNEALSFGPILAQCKQLAPPRSL